MLRQSDRFGVTPMSSTVSRRARTSIRFRPVGVSGGRISSPDASGPIPSSSSEQSIPSEASPRIFELLMTKPPGISAPTVARATTSPGFIFGAPHTMGSGSPPVVTSRRWSFSASGWRLMVRIFAVTTPVKAGVYSATASTSRPAIVSRSASSCGVMSMST